MSIETVEPTKTAESNGENAPTPGVNRRGLGRLAINSVVMIAMLAALLSVQDRLTAETKRAAVLRIDGIRRAVTRNLTDPLLRELRKPP